MKKVIIAGSRTVNDYQFLKAKLDHLLANLTDIEIVSGHAKGTDLLGEQYAKDRNLPIKVFYPNWDKFGKYAGIERNKRMGDYADYLVAFWDGKSKGTKHMIEYAKEKQLKVKVVYV